MISIHELCRYHFFYIKTTRSKRERRREREKDIGIIKCINRQHNNQMGHHFVAVQNQRDFEYNNITAPRK